jgi:NADH:ubiquinone oxidoreductase subunit 3 (subunit A)
LFLLAILVGYDYELKKGAVLYKSISC